MLPTKGQKPIKSKYEDDLQDRLVVPLQRNNFCICFRAGTAGRQVYLWCCFVALCIGHWLLAEIAAKRKTNKGGSSMFFL